MYVMNIWGAVTQEHNETMKTVAVIPMNLFPQLGFPTVVQAEEDQAPCCGFKIKKGKMARTYQRSGNQ